MMCELGWLYSKVVSFINRSLEDRSLGLVAQSFCHALREELADYYRLVAVLESQLNRDSSGSSGGRTGGGSRLTLRRLYVWTQDPLERMRLMAVLVDSVGEYTRERERPQEKEGGRERDSKRKKESEIKRGREREGENNPCVRPYLRMTLLIRMTPPGGSRDGGFRLHGGALASAVHNFTKHGDPAVRAFVTKVVWLSSAPTQTAPSITSPYNTPHTHSHHPTQHHTTHTTPQPINNQPPPHPTHTTQPTAFRLCGG
jgi:hypothetical protein